MTYYKKHGRRYVPIAEDMAFSAYDEGTYLVTVKPGWTSSIKTIQPEYATIVAAIKEFEGLLLEKLLEASALKLPKDFDAANSKKRKEAHERLKSLMDEIGTDVLWQDSPSGIVESVSKVLTEKSLERHVTVESDELLLAAFKALLTRYCLVTSETPESAMQVVKKDLVDIGIIPENVSIKLT